MVPVKFCPVWYGFAGAAFSPEQALLVLYSAQVPSVRATIHTRWARRALLFVCSLVFNTVSARILSHAEMKKGQRNTDPFIS